MWLMLVVHVCVVASAMVDSLGIAIGHMYYFVSITCSLVQRRFGGPCLHRAHCVRVDCCFRLLQLEDVYPLMVPSRKRVLATPRVLTLLFAGGGNNVPVQPGVADAMPAVNFDREALIQRAIDERRAAEAAAANGQPPPQPQAEQQPEPQGVRLVD